MQSTKQLKRDRAAREVRGAAAGTVGAPVTKTAYADRMSAEAFADMMKDMSPELCHKASAVWAAAGTSDPMSIPEVHERYAKLPKGEA